MTFIDGFVFLAILCLTAASVVYGQKKAGQKSGHDSFLDHLLMGRSLTLPLFTFTLVSTWYGGIFGVAKIAFENGIYNFISQGVFWYASYIVFALFILPKIGQSKHLTLPQMVKQRLGNQAGNWVGILNVFNLVPIAYTVSLGLFLKTLFSFPLAQGMTLGVLLVLGYSLVGGFRSVVYSDLIQFFVMLSSVILVFVISFFTHGLFPLQNLPAHYYALSSDKPTAELWMWGLIAFGTLVDPNFYQRSYAAQDQKTAKRGIFCATLIWMIFDLCLTFGAMYARSLMPEAGAEDGYFQYSIGLLPAGLKGYFLAGILATILSTMDSYLFLAGSTLSFDILKSKSINRQRLSIVFVGVISIFFGLYSEGNIEVIWGMLGSLSTASLLIPMLGLYFLPKMNQGIFLTSSIGGAIACCITFFYQTNPYPIYIGLITSLILMLLLILRPSQ